MYRIKQFFNDIKWWILHRTFYRYHVLKLNLKPGYYDTDYLLEEAMYQLLIRYVEKEQDGLAGILEYMISLQQDIEGEEKKLILAEKSNREHIELNITCMKQNIEDLTKIAQIYLWAVKGRKNFDRVNKKMEWLEREEEKYKQDTEILKLLVEVRNHLWT